MSNPIDPKDAVDLAAVAERKRATDEARAEIARRKQDEMIARVAVSWDRAMQRAFKGIMPRSVRHRYLQRGITS